MAYEALNDGGSYLINKLINISLNKNTKQRFILTITTMVEAASNTQKALEILKECE